MAASTGSLCEALRKVAITEIKSTVDRASHGQADNTKDKCVLLDQSLLDPLRFTQISDKVFTGENHVVHIDTVSELSSDDTVRDDLNFFNLVCYVRPSLRLMEPLARRIKAYEKLKPGRMRVTVYFVPKRTVMVHHVLRENGIVDDGAARGEMGLVPADIEDLEIDMFPLDDDLLSMELPFVYRDLFLDGDLSILKSIARSMVKLQSAFTGPIPNVHGKGAMARRVVDMMKRMKADLDSEYMQEIPSTIDTLIVVDRGVDLLTPFMSQLTYEGIIDETYGISASAMSIDNPGLKLNVPRPIRIPNKEPRPVFEGSILLNSGDDVHGRIRDYLVNNVGAELHRWSQEIKANYDRRKALSNNASGANQMDQLKEMRNIVQSLPKWQETQRLIGVHVDITTELNKLVGHARFRKQQQVERHIILGSEDKMVNEYIEELIDRVEPMPKVLRLLAMMSLCNGGIKQKQLETLRQSMMHAYGFPQVLSAFYNFERAGLIVRQSGGLTEKFSLLGKSGNEGHGDGPVSASSVPFGQLRKTCRLMPDGSADAKPPPAPMLGDVPYFYRGYSSLLCKIVEDLVNTNDPSAGSSGGPGAAGGAGAGTGDGNKAAAQAASSSSSGNGPATIAPGPRFSERSDSQFAPTGQRKILVLVVGGATRAEIACLRNAIGGDAVPTGSDGDMMPSQRRSTVLIATTSLINGNELCRSMLPFEAM